MTADTSTQPRPWAVVARFPEPFEQAAAVAHFAAMTQAHHLAYAAGIVTAQNREEVLAISYRHYFPMIAAFTAAGLHDGWDPDRVRAAIESGSGIPEWCWQWLTAAGINPAGIRAAS